MKKALLASVMGAAFVVAGVVGVQATAAPAPALTVAVPERADDFQLTDHTRLAHQLYYFKDASAIVVMTETNGSKLSRDNAAQLEALKAAYAGKGVLFYMLNSNLGDTRDATAAEAKAQGYDIPVLMDERQLVGEQLGVQREGEVFVIDVKNNHKIAYLGPLSAV